MSRMSEKLIKTSSFFLLCFILAFYSISKSYGKVDNKKIQNWIEGIPILPTLIENKKDVVEFDSSNGKIISISFDIKSSSKKQIFSFYKNFFKEKKWDKDKNENVWRIKSKSVKNKIFKIENIENNILIIKIIIENF